MVFCIFKPGSRFASFLKFVSLTRTHLSGCAVDDPAVPVGEAAEEGIIDLSRDDPPKGLKFSPPNY